MKKTALFLALILTIGLVGCGAPQEKAEREEKGEVEESKAETFSGKYIVEAGYVKDNLDNLVLVDARGDEARSEERRVGKECP